MKMKNTISKLNALLALTLILVLLVGSLAYFTDRVTGDATATTMDKTSLDIVPEPDPDADPDDPTKKPEDYVDPTPDNPDDDLTNWWLYLNTRAKVNFNPGDKMDLSYILVNKGKLAVDVRETFIITTSLPLTATQEFALFSTFQTDSAGANTGLTSAGTMTKIDDTHYKYTPPQFTLSSDTETIGSAPKQFKCNYYLIFNALSGNTFQGAKCTIDYTVEAKQHTEGNLPADWVTAATATMTLGGQTTAVVPKS